MRPLVSTAVLTVIGQVGSGVLNTENVYNTVVEIRSQRVTHGGFKHYPLPMAGTI